MATLVLQTAGAAVGGLFGPLGATVGRAVGGLAGALVDRALIGGERSEGARLSSLEVQTADEGRPIPRVYGRVRIAGTVIWATRLEEEAVDQGGGKGGATTRSYRYYANFAVGICEGPVTRIGRIWADGKPLDLADITVRLHKGNADAAPDPLIAAKQVAAPAYRGLAYAVFERLPLDPFGNRIPQLAFEVIRVVDRLEGMVRAVTMIPGSTEFGYATSLVTRSEGIGVTVSDNRHVGIADTDFEAALDEVVELCPRLERISLVVAWFGDDLRAAHCGVRPKVEGYGRDTRGLIWSVGGLERAHAEKTSEVNGRPAYGGTPADATVIEAIRAIKARGLKVVFYPFILMDVPAGNALPDPYGGPKQAKYPWRGRITVDPAPGLPGTPDGTAAAAAAVSAFVGTAQPGDFSVGGGVGYAGPEEWSLRRMILHYAHLVGVAGGVDAFLVGSELRGLTSVRSSRTTFPFVDALVDLVHDVRGVVGPATRISYAADWSEFFGFQPADGSGDVRFHLDPLWADEDVDFVGIDAYWPLADWRDGEHADAAASPSTYDLGYLKGNVAGGEGFDWHYASPSDRRAGVRTPITDGAHGKPWVFRYKDLLGWWDNVHVERLDGIEAGPPTAWQPRMKPFWLTETGCPAVDRGANQPNVFVDPKSSESHLPYFSDGSRDDAIQRRYLEVVIGRFDPTAEGFVEADNPTGPAGRMLTPGAIHLWTWDARPWPAFPALGSVWADGENWRLGHWLSGRLGATSLKALVGAMLADHGFADFAIEGLDGVVDGYVVDRPASPRAAIAPLAEAFSFAGFDRGTEIVFADLGRAPVASFAEADLVDADEGRSALAQWTRTQDSELPQELRLGHFDTSRDFVAAVAASRRIEGASRRVTEIGLSLAAPAETMRKAADTALHDRWTARDRVRFALPPSSAAIEPGDVVRLPGPARTRDVLVEEIEDGGARYVVARALERAVFRPAAAESDDGGTEAPPVYGPPAVRLLDLPSIDESVPAHRPWVAATARPWPGGLSVEASASGEAFAMLATIERPARIGTLAAGVGPGPEDFWDRGGRLSVVIARALESRAEADVLAGANLIAVAAANGLWEILQFATATLVAPDTYALTDLLRARFGTEEAMAAGLPAGAAVVVLDTALASLPLDRAAIGRAIAVRVAAAGADPVRAGSVLDFTPLGRGLRPLSPVHLRASRDPASGDVAIGWIRRTRIGGEGWSAEEVPLGEEAEAYRLDILDGATVKRTITTAAPAAVYAAADQIADFGAPPAALALRVAQVAPGYGAGTYREALIDV
jgi:hypothetical protein